MRRTTSGCMVLAALAAASSSAGADPKTKSVSCGNLTTSFDCDQIVLGTGKLLAVEATITVITDVQIGIAPPKVMNVVYYLVGVSEIDFGGGDLSFPVAGSGIIQMGPPLMGGPQPTTTVSLKGSATVVTADSAKLSKFVGKGKVHFTAITDLNPGKSGSSAGPITQLTSLGARANVSLTYYYEPSVFKPIPWPPKGQSTIPPDGSKPK